jgi:hypothetical protein
MTPSNAELDGNLVLRRATLADLERVAEFNAFIRGIE